MIRVKHIMDRIKVRIDVLSKRDLRFMIRLLENYKQMKVRRSGYFGEGEKITFPYLRTLFFRLGEALKEEMVLQEKGKEGYRQLCVPYDPDRLGSVPKQVRIRLVNRWKQDLNQKGKHRLSTVSAPLWELLRDPEAF